MRAMSRVVVRAVWLSSSVAFGLASCGDSTDEKLRAIELAGQCSLNSDCQGDLVCIFEHCHVQCADNDDCRPPLMPYVSRCVRSPSGVNVCQLEADRDCGSSADCQGDQICAADSQCRDACTQRDPCIEGLLCSLDGACARADELDAQGRLRGPGGAGGQGGAAASGGAPVPSEGGGGAGGAESGSGGEGDGPPAPGGGGGASGEEGGAGGESGGGAPVTEAESEPNNSLAEAHALTVDTTVTGSISPPDDQDFYSLTAPAAPASGGFFRVYLTDVSTTSSIAIEVRSILDNGKVVSDDGHLTGGKSLFGYFSAAPGADFYIKVSRWTGGAIAELDYRLRVDYTPVVDVHEPNDTQLEPASIELGEPATAYMFAGLETASAQAADYADWYLVEEAPSGTLNVKIDSVPLNVRLLARVFDANTLAGLGIEQQGAMDGAPLDFDVVLPSAGPYLIRVRPNAAPTASASTDAPGEQPDHFTRPYVLTVTSTTE